MTYTVWQQFVQNDAGDVLGSATIEVRDESTGALATIYSGPSGGALSNPFTAGVDGLGKFYAAAGSYKITATSGTNTATYRHQPLGTSQYADTGTADGNVPLADDVIFRITTEATTARTLSTADIAQHIRCTSGSATTITVPASVFAVNDELRVFREGAGTVAFSAAPGVTINAKALGVSPQYGCATLKCVAADEFDLYGDLA
jgi:hypothetical protein